MPAVYHAMLNSPMLSIFQHFHAIPLRSPLISLRSKWRLTGFSRRFTPKNPVRLHNPFGQLPRWGAKNVLPLNLIASFPAGRAYDGQDTDLLQIHLSGLPKANKGKRPLLCTHPKLFVHGDLSEIRTHYTSEYPALQDPVRAGYSYHCSLVGLSGFEPETSSM